MRHVGEVAFATFSPDGTRVVTASSDQTARLWDVVTSTPIGPPMRHEGGVVSATFSPDGRRVVTRSSDSSARLWDVSWPSGNIVEIACAFLADHDLRDPQQRFGFVLDQPICQPPPPFDPARIIER
jgi:WD40 repeat protein